MLSREFTKKEKILLLVCLVLALGVIYYVVVYKGIRTQMANYTTDELESEIEIEQTRSAQIAQMQAVIEANKDKDAGLVMPYNNLANEINLVGDITKGKSEGVSVSWSTPVLNGTVIRRDAKISFTTRSYKLFKEILEAFNHCVYRCVIRDLSVTDNSSSTKTVHARVGGQMTTLTVLQTRRGIQHTTKMSVAFTVTFFETSEGATTMEGLIIEKSSDSDEPGVLESRAKAYSD